MHFDGIRIDSPRHAAHAQDVHREERKIEADEEQPEVQLAKRLAQHASGDFWEPVVEGTEQWEYRAAKQDVVEVRDDEISVVHLPIERHGGEHQAGKSADEEDEEEAADPPHGEFEMQTSAPKGSD